MKTEELINSTLELAKKANVAITDYHIQLLDKEALLLLCEKLKLN